MPPAGAVTAVVFVVATTAVTIPVAVATATVAPVVLLAAVTVTDVSQFSVRYEYVLFGAPDQGQTLDVYRSDF